MESRDDLLPLPSFKSDDEAERFVDEADLTEYDLSTMKPFRFEFADKKPPFSKGTPNSEA